MKGGGWKQLAIFKFGKIVHYVDQKACFLILPCKSTSNIKSCTIEIICSVWPTVQSFHSFPACLFRFAYVETTDNFFNLFFLINVCKFSSMKNNFFLLLKNVLKFCNLDFKREEDIRKIFQSSLL